MSAKRIKALKTLAHDKDGTVYGYYLPADAESYGRMVEQMHTEVTAAILAAYVRGQLGADVVQDTSSVSDVCRAALAAIGITKPKEGRK